MTATRRWQIPLLVVLAIYLGTVATLYLRLPIKDGARDWFAPLMKGGWMAWSFPSALFFLTILLLLSLMRSASFTVSSGILRFSIPRMASSF